MDKIINTNDKVPVISSKDLSISYELHRERTKLIALKNISLDVKKGEFVVLVGPSGCGKTSFINAVAGLVEPESGVINVNGNPVKGPGPDRAMVFQDYALMPWKTVESNIRIPFEFQNLGISIEDQNKRIKDCINLVDLNGFEKSFPYELSGGNVKDLPSLPISIGGDVDFMIGTKYLCYHPETIFNQNVSNKR